ncbi:MAG: 16S rRNA (cytidine(1402)-2'-O)-methyltransferase [Oscillospiraceae bacterium]|nr:16S rRNA (cytidine(1402)-2'-O)-methyltransferase [Oscillospiraceae bacterium]
MSGTLYLVGTPIGNLGDLSPRAQETLHKVDFIAAEDTRVTIKLLNHFEIKKPMISYYAHNRRQRGVEILARLRGGESCALVTDAGMPAVSDPGEELVTLCAEAEIEIICVPGPSAFVTALSLSGLPTGRFTFEGFLSTAAKSRRDHLKSLTQERRTMVFYEAPHKIAQTLNDMLNTWGDRRIAISRELTKRYEETIRTTLAQAVVRYAEDGEKPRGEFVLIIEGAPPPTPMEEAADLNAALVLLQAMTADGTSLKDAARQIAADTGIARNVLYTEALKMRGDGENDC